MQFNQQQILTFLKWLLIAFFGFLICFEIFYAISHHYYHEVDRRILILLILIIIILVKKRYTWVIALFFFIYGMYNIIITGTYASSPTIMDFTGHFKFYFSYRTDSLSFRVIDKFPIIFYFLAFLTFATPTVRKWYGFASFKGKSQKSYLR